MGNKIRFWIYLLVSFILFGLMVSLSRSIDFGETAVETSLPATGYANNVLYIPFMPFSVHEMPFFSQLDPKWRDVRLAGMPDTIGTSGCALSSAAMVYAYYGADTNPEKLNACLDQHDISSIWPPGTTIWKNSARLCSDGKAKFLGQLEFSWESLNYLVNEEHDSVILCMHSDNWTFAHCTTIVSGHGSGKANYLVNDPMQSETSTLEEVPSYLNYDFMFVYKGS